MNHIPRQKCQISGTAQNTHHPQIGAHGWAWVASLHGCECHAGNASTFSHLDRCELSCLAQSAQAISQLQQQLPVKDERIRRIGLHLSRILGNEIVFVHNSSHMKRRNHIANAAPESPPQSTFSHDIPTHMALRRLGGLWQLNCSHKARILTLEPFYRLGGARCIPRGAGPAT